MNKPGSFSIGFKPKSLPAKGPPKPKTKPIASSRVIFGSNDDGSDSDSAPQPAAFSSSSKTTSKTRKQKPSRSPSPQEVAITEFDYDPSAPAPEPAPSSPAHVPSSSKRKKPSLSSQKPKPKPPPAKTLDSMSSSLTSRKHLEEAQSLDPTIFDYDGIYDTLKKTYSSKPSDPATAEDGAGLKSRYMTSLVQSSTIRTRDRQIAEEKKLARERAAEGDMFADKEKFVTAAYKKQQEENARLAEEEKRREEEENKRNGTGGMSGFYKKLLEEDERRHERIVKAAEEAARLKAEKKEERGDDSTAGGNEKEEEDAKEEAPELLARKINSLGGSVLINDDGEVVDKRELLRGGLNVKPKPKPKSSSTLQSLPSRPSSHSRPGGVFSGTRGKQALRQRQTKQIEEQLAVQLKRSLEQEEEERARVERAAKSRKTEKDISSARERYLARKKAAEEAKRKGLDPI